MSNFRRDPETLALLAALAPQFGGQRIYIPKTAPPDVGQMRELQSQGVSRSEIAKRMGCNPYTVTKRLRGF